MQTKENFGNFNIEDSDNLTVDPLLHQILSTKRAHGSEGDSDFRLWLFNYLKLQLKLKPVIRTAGVIYVETDPKSTVLFSCHVDTVHSSLESFTGSKQELSFDPVFGHLFLRDKANSSCLGGDDGVGIYILLKMLEAGVAGKYVFHTGEECGGVGSKAFVAANKKELSDIEMVVAFDRAVLDQCNPEVIVTQGGKACASLEFGESLCTELNKFNFDLPYVVSHKGSFTDSKVYSDDVPECVNIGCFYARQHSSDEYVDVVGVEKLLEAAIKLDWSKLPIVRKPQKSLYTENFTAAKSANATRSNYKSSKPLNLGKFPKATYTAKKLFATEQEKFAKSTVPNSKNLSLFDIEELVVGSPDEAVNFIVELMLENSALEAHVVTLRKLAEIK